MSCLWSFEELSQFPDPVDVRLVAAGTHRDGEYPLCPVQVRGAVAHVAEHEFELCYLSGFSDQIETISDLLASSYNAFRDNLSNVTLLTNLKCQKKKSSD